MKQQKKLFILLLGALTFSATTGTSIPIEKIEFAAPSVIPGTIREMKSPGFWISRYSAPDKIILDAQEIHRFNHELVKKSLTKDLLNIQESDVAAVKTFMLGQIRNFRQSKFFDKDARNLSNDFLSSEEKALASKKDLVLRYGFVLKNSEQRLIPTDEVLTAEPLDLEFDEVQNSSFDAGEPVVVIDETPDKQWMFTITNASVGWVKSAHIELCSRDDFKRLYNFEKMDVAVVISAKADLYKDAKRREFYDFVRMGAKFAVKAVQDDVLEVWIASGKSVFIHRADVNFGFLPYTPRTIITQAFKMLNAPYGWGGVNGEQDCSAFLKGVFATVGLELPRNSGEQGQVGREVKFKDAIPGVTVVQMKGHIVLYLGMYEGRPFVIHEAYAYREPAQSGDRARVVNRVIVSDLFLGKGSRKGSLLERIVAIKEYR